jgi:hypothetical protein
MFKPYAYGKKKAIEDSIKEQRKPGTVKRK